MPWTMPASAARWFSSMRRQSTDVLEPPVRRWRVRGPSPWCTGRDCSRGRGIAASSAPHTPPPGVDPLLAWPLEMNAEPEVALDLDEAGRPSRIERLRASSQRCSSARLSDCAGSVCSVGSVFSRHPSSSNTTCRLSAAAGGCTARAAASTNPVSGSAAWPALDLRIPPLKRSAPVTPLPSHLRDPPVREVEPDRRIERRQPRPRHVPPESRSRSPAAVVDAFAPPSPQIRIGSPCGRWSRTGEAHDARSPPTASTNARGRAAAIASAAVGPSQIATPTGATAAGATWNTRPPVLPSVHRFTFSPFSRCGTRRPSRAYASACSAPGSPSPGP